MVLKNILDSVDSERITIIYRNIGYDKFTVGLKFALWQLQ